MKNMIGISAQEHDADGDIVLEVEGDSNVIDLIRRVQRSKTLDQGVAIVDSGFTHGDRTVALTVDVTEDEFNRLAGIQENNTFVHMTSREGVFLAAFQRLAYRGGRARITLLIKEKVTS